MIHNEYQVQLILHRQELAATIEAIYDALIRRVKWTVRRDDRQTPGGWASLDLETVQDCVDQLSAAMAKTLIILRELDGVHPDFEKLFSPDDYMWDVINGITLASSWEEVPVHGQHQDCSVCRSLDEV